MIYLIRLLYLITFIVTKILQCVKMSTKRLHTNNVSFKIYIKKVLKAVHPSMRITSDALHQLNAVLNYIAEDVAREANSLADSKGKKTLKAREVMSACRLVFPGELAKHAYSESTKAVTKYNSPNKSIYYFSHIFMREITLLTS